MQDVPGDSGGSRANGIGDFKFAVGHLIDGTGRFRWGLGLAGTFDTASEPQFGNGAFTLSPIWGAGFRFTPDLELVANVQYNASVAESSGRNPGHSLELKPALLKIGPLHYYSLFGWESSWDFDSDNLHRGKLKLEIGKGLGERQQWVLYTGVDAPVIHGGQENFSFKVGLNYVFQ